MWQIPNISVVAWSRRMIMTKSQEAFNYNPDFCKHLCGLNVLVFLLNRNKDRMCFLHISYMTIAKLNDNLYMCSSHTCTSVQH